MEESKRYYFERCVSDVITDAPYLSNYTFEEKCEFLLNAARKVLEIEQYTQVLE